MTRKELHYLLDWDRFCQLAQPVMTTEYFAKAGVEAEAFGHLLNDDMYVPARENDDTEDDNYVVGVVEELIFAVPTDILPQPLVDLAGYIYGLALEIGDAVRINDYGTLYYMGRIGTQDFDKAEEMYAHAAALGSDVATENLGYIYYYGRTGEVNYEKAFRQFSKAASVYGRACSTYKLGDMYKNGYHVTKDVDAAYSCYRRAEEMIDNGKPENDSDRVAGDIYLRLGDCLCNGEAGCVDLVEALKYYQRAERAFILRVSNGDFLVRKMLTRAKERQESVRRQIEDTLPKMEWAENNVGYKTL